MTADLEHLAAELRRCWNACDTALLAGDSDEANAALARAFEAVDACQAIDDSEVRGVRFLATLTWVKLATILENCDQDEPADEARQQAFNLLDGMFNPPVGSVDSAITPLGFLAGLASEETIDLVGRLYMLCSKAGRRDALLWGRCFMDLDNRLHDTRQPSA